MDDANNFQVVEKVVYVDAPVPPPIVKFKKNYIKPQPRTVKVEKIVEKTPDPKVVVVKTEIEKEPKIVEKLVYVQKPAKKPEVIWKEIDVYLPEPPPIIIEVEKEEWLPQQTVYQEVIIEKVK